MRRSPLLVLAAVALAASPAGAHDWYTGLRSPQGVDCCGGHDCRPVPYRIGPKSGREEIEANGAWWPVEQDKVLPFSSPDGNAHACWPNPHGRPAFFCIILPGMAELGRPALPFSSATSTNEKGRPG